jgi:hypothetical protein
MASFFAEIVANTGRHEAVFHSRTISAKNAKRKGKNKNPPSPPSVSSRTDFNKGGLGGIKECLWKRLLKNWLNSFSPLMRPL